MAPDMSQVEEVERRIAKVMATMEPTLPNLLRTVPAHLALARCAMPLQLRRQISKIQDFWSHSWHGRRWNVILTVLLRNNSTAAFLLSSLAAGILGVLFALGHLPEVSVTEHRANTTQWSQYGGIVVYFTTLLLWPNRTRIFLDMLCINQHDEKEKVHALISMAAILKRSDSLVVFWDFTYARRLWCVFELAAPPPRPQPQRLIIQPAIVGPCFLSVTVALSILSVLVGLIGDGDQTFFRVTVGVLAAFCFYTSISTFRSYFQSIRQCQREMKHFELQRASCWCCTSNHISPDGQPMPCDRKILSTCIQQWFGSVAEFERQVRAEMETRLSSQLWSEMMSYKQCLLSMAPLLWSTMDLFSAEINFHVEFHGRYIDGGILELVRGLSLWLGVGPFLICMAVRMAQCCPNRGSTGVDVLLNVAIVLVLAVMLVGILFLETQVWFWLVGLGVEHKPLEIGSGLFCLLFMTLAVIGFRCGRRLPTEVAEGLEAPNAQEEEVRGEDPAGRSERTSL
eukprot:Skav218538  [mRNA]  locus=scaffold2478:569595:571127:- [translate_table: standard]